ncbi:ChaB family protein [Gloeobacter kilaueensis]|uniref:Cation transport regulator n=1 Tax=Gloeobacter kilaueensis (strain ATCC BAA-2537 / CCAP 1431/1 / ULC 316 / JS1) TaxID=1183438 RepID=U5QS93_GLOK1|nr:ChaB family protein [Gloeobacter kilaueensis]AGY60504.1 cation transport regulator [Gloeobacter kilaueensis JS1]
MVQSLESQKPVYTGEVEKAVTAVFKDQQQVDQAVRRLLDSGIDRKDISIVGRNFQSNTRVSGFLTRGDVIRGGLVNGAIYGALFGSALSLLTGIGVLFVPFVGAVVAAGPIGAALLGAAGGAIAGSAGGGLASVLATIGMSQDKINTYQTRLEAGEFVVVAEGYAAQIDQIESILREAGGEEITVADQTLPREKPGSFSGPEELAPHVREHLSPAAQKTYIDAYNADHSASGSDEQADAAAWEAVRKAYTLQQDGTWA